MLRKKILGIYTDDMGYAGRLMDYLSTRNDVKMEVRAFTTKESLLDYQKSFKLDALLVDDTLRESALDVKGIDDFIWLAGERQSLRNEEKSVFKFQKVERIVKDLLGVVMQRNDREEVSDGKMGGGEIIGVYTPYGDSKGLSLALAEAFAQNYATLYVNMEWFPYSEEGEKGLTDLLYFIHENKKDFTVYLSTLTERKGNVDVLAPVNHFKDLLDMNEDDVHRLFQELRDNANYEKTVVQMDSIGEYTFEMLEECNRVIMPIWKNQTGKEKMEAIKRYLEMEGKDDLMERIHVVETPIQTDQGFPEKVVRGVMK